MSQPVYTLLRKKGTGELHLFEGRITQTDPSIRCSVSQYSICEGMNRDEKESQKFGCKTEDVARRRTAEIGREVCGTCVSHLYETYP